MLAALALCRLVTHYRSNGQRFPLPKINKYIKNKKLIQTSAQMSKFVSPFPGY
jgi:hypothetical protein